MRCKKKFIKHDYGLDIVPIVLSSGDFGWDDPTPTRQIILANPMDCKNKITVSSLVSAWKGLGHLESVYLLSALFINRVIAAIENNENTADITYMFDRDFVTPTGQEITKDEIFCHLIPYFKIVNDTENSITVILKIK